MTDRPPYRILGDPDRAAGPFLFTCEHASNRTPGVTPSEPDAALLGDHWGWDIGAADVTEALVALTDGVAVLSDFSRLLVDPNRPPDSPTLVVARCDGQDVSFNRGLDAATVGARVARLHQPYHAAIDATARRRLARGPVRLVSVHSFTPVWQDAPRWMEIGVLFDDHEPGAERLVVALGLLGFAVARNAPYSGREGLMYAVDRHGRALGVPCVELEIRQDLVSTPERARAVAEQIARALPTFG